MIWYDFGPIRTSGSIVSTLTLHSLTGTLKGPGPFVISWSITLKIELWAPYTIWQAVLKGQVILRQKANFEPD